MNNRWPSIYEWYLQCSILEKDDSYDPKERRSGPKKKEGGHESMHFTINKANRKALGKIKGSKSDFIDGLITPMAEQLDPGPASVILLKFWNGLVDETKEELGKGNTDTAAALCQVVRVIKQAIQPHLDLCEDDNVSALTQESKKNISYTEHPPNNTPINQIKSENMMINSSKNSFSKSVTEKINILQKIQDTIFLLESVVILYGMAPQDTRCAESKIKDIKQKCNAYVAELNKIIQERFTHLDRNQTNQYQKFIDSVWTKHCSQWKYTKKLTQFHNMTEFRNGLSQIILEMRNACFEYCNEFSAKDTYEKNAIADSCNFVSILLNKLAQKDLDLVVESYQYDKSLDMLTVDLSELKMLSRHSITQVYLDKQYCEFGINSDKKTIPPYPDYTIWFYPYGVIDDNSHHILTIIMQCAEFSFKINGDIKTTGSLFLDHMKNEPQDIKFVSTIISNNSNGNIPLTAKMGGEIKEIIESYDGKKFVCSYCGKEHNCIRWMGYLHDGGTPDKDNKKYWMMIKCIDSNNYVSLHKILNRIVKS